VKELFDESDNLSASLSHDLIGIDSGTRRYYGGSQNLYRTLKERQCGCGIVGAADVLLYLEALRSGEYCFSEKKFLEFSALLRKKFIPIIPGRGVNAFWLARGLNRYFRKNNMNYRAYWKCTPFNKWKQVERMLGEDIPVIMAIGNNFPIVWGKKSVNLYVKDESKTGPEAVYKKDQSVYGHFVVVTGIEGNCLTVSSWGKKFFINIDEYNKYVFRHSTHMYSNILVIERRSEEFARRTR